MLEVGRVDHGSGLTLDSCSLSTWSRVGLTSLANKVSLTSSGFQDKRNIYLISRSLSSNVSLYWSHLKRQPWENYFAYHTTNSLTASLTTLLSWSSRIPLAGPHSYSSVPLQMAFWSLTTISFYKLLCFVFLILQLYCEQRNWNAESSWEDEGRPGPGVTYPLAFLCLCWS